MRLRDISSFIVVVFILMIAAGKRAISPKPRVDPEIYFVWVVVFMAAAVCLGMVAANLFYSAFGN